MFSFRLSHNPRARETERQREAEKVSEDEGGERGTSRPLSLTVWCWGVPRTAEVVGGWRGGTGGAAGPRTAPPHPGACRSGAGSGPAAACGASWSGKLTGARGETLPTGSSGTAGPGAAGARPGPPARPGCRVGTCRGRRARRGAGGR